MDEQINFNRSPFKAHVMRETQNGEWVKRADLCGRLIRNGGDTPADTFEYRRQAIISLVRAGYLETKTGTNGAIYVRQAIA